MSSATAGFEARARSSSTREDEQICTALLLCDCERQARNKRLTKTILCIHPSSAALLLARRQTLA